MALKSSLDTSNGIVVRSIEDLVRLADELNRPILYKYSEDSKEIDRFFVTFNDELYVFELDDSIKGESHAGNK